MPLVLLIFLYLQVFPFDVAYLKMSKLRGAVNDFRKLKIYVRHLFTLKTGEKSFQIDLTTLMKNRTP